MKSSTEAIASLVIRLAKDVEKSIIANEPDARIDARIERFRVAVHA